MLLNKRQKRILAVIRDWGGMKKETLAFLCGESGFERDFIQLSQLGLLKETAGYFRRSHSHFSRSGAKSCTAMTYAWRKGAERRT